MVRLRSSAWVLASQVLSLAMSIPANIVLARALGPEGKGEVALVQLVASVGVVFLSLGLPSAVTYLAARGEAGPRRTNTLTVLMSGASALILVLVYLVTGGWLADNILHFSDPRLLLLGVAGLAASLAVAMMSSYLIGVGRIRDAATVTVATLGLQLISYVVLAVSGTMTALTAASAWLAGVALSYVALSVLAGPGSAKEATLPTLWRSALPYGLAAWAAGAVGFAVLRGDMFIMSYLVGTAPVGVYSVAVSVSELVFYVPRALNTVLVPKVASQPNQAQELTARLCRTAWLPTLAVGVAVAVAGTILIVPVFGGAYREAIPAVWWLIPGVIGSSIAGPIVGYYSGIGRPVEAVWANLANLAVNLAGNFMLIPLLGVPGASVASSVSYWVGAILLGIRFSRRTGTPLSHLIVPRRNELRDISVSLRTALRERAGRA